ncbi:Scr1 family TA system antitoxin-like transcriptional regulator, partial [Streptomyces sp. NPDC001493]
MSPPAVRRTAVRRCCGLSCCVLRAVVRRPGRAAGGPAVLKEQLLHLLDCIERLNHLTVQVVPSD